MTQPDLRWIQEWTLGAARRTGLPPPAPNGSVSNHGRHDGLPLYPSVNSSERSRWWLTGPPHSPDDSRYAPLIRLARIVATAGMVVVTSGDAATAQLVLNWVHHARALAIDSFVVLCWDASIYELLQRLHIASYDSSAALRAWCPPVQQYYHAQRVFMERLVAIGALILSGLSVLHADADCLFLRDFRPWFTDPNVQIFAQADMYPQEPVSAFGATACMGFIYLRSTDAVSRFLDDAIALSHAQAEWSWQSVVEVNGRRSRTATTP